MTSTIDSAENIGEIYLCNKDSNGSPILLRNFKGLKIKKLCGGGSRAFIIEDIGGEMGRIHSLHPPEFDDYDFTFTENDQKLETQPQESIENKTHELATSRTGRPEEYISVDNYDQKQPETSEGQARFSRTGMEGAKEGQNSGEYSQRDRVNQEDLENIEVNHLSQQIEDERYEEQEQLHSAFDSKGSISEIVAGKNHLLMVNETGEIFSYGYGEYGVMGRGGKVYSQLPQKISNLKNVSIKKAASGYNHALVLTDSYDLYAWGRGFEGQLGLERLNDFDMTDKYSEIKQKNEVNFGESYRIKASSFPRVLRFFHQLKFEHPPDVAKKMKADMSYYFYHMDMEKDKSKKDWKKYLKMVNEENVIEDVVCGAYHSMAVTAAGDLYGWGANDCFQLGFKSKIAVWAPTRISLPNRVMSVACGYAHSVVLLRNGSVVTFGLNHKYQLGVGDNDKRAEQCTLDLDELGNELPLFTQIACGDYNNFALSEEGKVYSWGSGVLGMKGVSVLSRPRLIDGELSDRKIRTIYANSGNAIFFTPLSIKSMRPSSGPSSGGTIFNIIGTGLCDIMGKQIIRFNYGQRDEETGELSGKVYSIVVPLIYDDYTNSFSCTTPNFEAPAVYDDIEWPMIADISVSLDGESWIDCEPKFFIYGANVRVTGLNPKFGSKEGGIEVQIDTNANDRTLNEFVNINVGFQPYKKLKEATENMEDSIVKSEDSDSNKGVKATQKATNPIDLSPDSPELDKDDWKCFNAVVRNGLISFKVPSIKALEAELLFYHIDISFNGQQFLGSPSTFRYYSFDIERIQPDNTIQDGSTMIIIHGSGFFDTITKKIKLENSFGERLIDAKWSKENRYFYFYTPPISWLAGNMDTSGTDYTKLFEEKVKISLTISGGTEWIYVGEYFYYDPKIEKIIPGPEADKKLTAEEIEENWTKAEEITDPFEGLNEKETDKKKIEIEKKEKDDSLEIEHVPRAPGSYLYLMGDFIEGKDVKVRFQIENNFLEKQAIWKNKHKLGVVVPNIEGPEQGLYDVEVSLSFNGGQQYGKEFKTIKYFCFGKDVAESMRAKLFDEEVKKARKLKK